MTNQPIKDKEFYLNSGNLFSDKIGHMTRRKDFREYLDRKGVLDKFTEIFMELYECPVMEFPNIEYIRKMMVKPNPDEEKISEIKTKLVEAYSFRDYLKTENEHLRAVLTANHTMSAEEE
ncbi:c-Myc-binding protein-like [Aphis gossypii]|uniref:c-Myc-binding protein-like n=1 Tax=Aphis gossypii TaxID=80765 RepID=UPI00100E54E4|nr:c-Myc-binding protein-like [Aphis gossypii]